MVIAVLDLMLGLVTAGVGGLLAVLLYRDPPAEGRALWALAVLSALVIAGGARLVVVGVWG